MKSSKARGTNEVKRFSVHEPPASRRAPFDSAQRDLHQWSYQLGLNFDRFLIAGQTPPRSLALSFAGWLPHRDYSLLSCWIVKKKLRLSPGSETYD